MPQPIGAEEGRRPPGLTPAGWWYEVVLVVAFVALTVALAFDGWLLDLDLAVRDWSDQHRPRPLHLVAHWLNYLGKGGPVLTPAAMLVAGWVAVRTRSARPLLPVAGAFALTYLTAGPLKLWIGRRAPHNTSASPEELFGHSAERSYPSGHVVNAIVWCSVIALLLTAYLPPPLLDAIRIGVPAVVSVAITYLSYHWLTDTVAALLLGLLLERLLRRVPWSTLRAPSRPPR